MSLVRILVDGRGLLEQWTDLAPGKPRHSPAVLEEFFIALTGYVDASGHPLTVVFEDQETPVDLTDLPPCPPQLSVVLTRPRQQAVQEMIRLAQKIKGQGPFLLVTDQSSPVELLAELGGNVVPCEEFLKSVRQALAEMEEEIARYNQRENEKFIKHG